MGEVITFQRPSRRPATPKGRLAIYACALDGGCWAIEHIPADGGISRHLGTRFAYHEAEQAARLLADLTSVEFGGEGT